MDISDKQTMEPIRARTSIEIRDRRNTPLNHDDPEVVSNWEVFQNGKFQRGFSTRKEAREYSRVLREEFK